MTTGTFSGSSISTAAPNCASGSSQDVWYSFVATDPTMSVFVQTTGSLNVGFEIIQNSCTAAGFACTNNNQGGFNESFIGNSFVVGQTYYIRVLNTAGNLTTATFNICVLNPTLSTNEFNKLNYVIHPNPVDNVLNIAAFETIKELSILDSLGKEVIFSKNSTNSIDVSKLAKGIYLVRITNAENKMVTYKLMKS